MKKVLKGFRIMIQSDNSVITNLVMQSVSKKTVTKTDYTTSDSIDVPTFGEYVTKCNNSNIDRLIHTVSHIRLDGPDVVIFQKNSVNRFFGGDLNSSISIEKEVLRIPKNEVIQLLQELYTSKED